MSWRWSPASAWQSRPWRSAGTRWRAPASLISAPTPGVPVPPATQPVLIMNLKSGGGKAEKFKLADECRARGIEPVVLQLGDDLLELAEAAIARGADVIGMAGGDGSQALVASVAAQRGVAHVVVPAARATTSRSTWASIAMMSSPRSMLSVRRSAAHRPGRGQRTRVRQQRVTRRVRRDHAVRGVPRREGGDHARQAADAARPGRRAQPGWTGPDGVHHESAHLIQVSNNRYSLRAGAGSGTRDRLDDGELGILAVEVSGTAAAVELAALVALRRPNGGVPSRPGRHRPSRSRPAHPSRRAWTVKPSSWIHPSGSASSRVRSACASRRGRSAMPPPPSRGNPRPRPWAMSGEWLKGTLPSACRVTGRRGRPPRREVPDRGEILLRPQRATPV